MICLIEKRIMDSSQKILFFEHVEGMEGFEILPSKKKINKKLTDEAFRIVTFGVTKVSW